MKLTFSKKTLKQFIKFDQKLRERLKMILRKFQSGGKVDIIKKSGSKDEYRIRIGDYRIILAKVQENFIVTEIGKRQNIYK